MTSPARGFGGLSDLALDSEDTYVVVTGARDNLVTVLGREADTGELFFSQILFNNWGHITGLDHPTSRETVAEVGTTGRHRSFPSP